MASDASAQDGQTLGESHQEDSRPGNAGPEPGSGNHCCQSRLSLFTHESHIFALTWFSRVCLITILSEQAEFVNSIHMTESHLSQASKLIIRDTQLLGMNIPHNPLYPQWQSGPQNTTSPLGNTQETYFVFIILRGVMERKLLDKTANGYFYTGSFLLSISSSYVGIQHSLQQEH